jgi:site-specific recombinase XerD
MQELLSPKQARDKGYIPVAEAEKRPNAPNRSTFNRRLIIDGQVVSPGIWVTKGSRPTLWVLESSLETSVSHTKEKDYHNLRLKWFQGMRTGIYAHKKKPASAEYVKNKLQWGLSKYWTLLGESPSLSGLTVDNFRTVMGHKELEVEHDIERDHFATKKSIYQAVCGFLAFLIDQGLKTEDDLNAIRKELPGATFKLKKRALDPEYIAFVLKFNRAWYDGRSQYDIESLEMLIYLYLYAGLRRMGAAGLKISNIDFKNEEMIVLEKGCKERIVPTNLFPELQPKMEEWINNIRRPSDSNFFMVNKDGEPLKKGCIKDKFRRLGMALRVDAAYQKLAISDPLDPTETPAARHRRLKKAAKEMAKTMKNKFSPHPLRHTFATQLANDGVPAAILQELLGHEQLGTTQGYIGITHRHIKDWANRRRDAGYKPLQVSKSSQSGIDDILDGLLDED